VSSTTASALLFIHGAGCTGEVFSEQLRVFAGSRAPNLPGHLCAGSPASIGEFADAIAALAQRERLQNVALAGHSMGGAIALELALRRPQWLQSVVVLGGGARMRVAPAFLDGLEANFEETARTLAAGSFFANPSAERVDAAVAMMKTVGRAQTLRDFGACDAFDVLERLAEIAVPLLALTGEEDRLMPPKFASALADRVRSGRARILSGAGHFVMVERPAETNATVAAFLER